MYVEFLFIENYLRKTWFPNCKFPFAFIIRCSCPHNNKSAHSILASTHLKLFMEENISSFHWNSQHLKTIKGKKKKRERGLSFSLPPLLFLSFWSHWGYLLRTNILICFRGPLWISSCIKLSSLSILRSLTPLAGVLYVM